MKDKIYGMVSAGYHWLCEALYMEPVEGVNEENPSFLLSFYPGPQSPPPWSMWLATMEPIITF
jgi:hypothetical protein